MGIIERLWGRLSRGELSRLTQDIKGKRTVGQHRPGSVPRLTLPNGSERQCWGVWPPHPARVFSTVGAAASPPKLQRHFLMRARCRAETTSSHCLFCNYADTHQTHMYTKHVAVLSALKTHNNGFSWKQFYLLPLFLKNDAPEKDTCAQSCWLATEG